jgi:hypothetical protein
VGSWNLSDLIIAAIINSGVPMVRMNVISIVLVYDFNCGNKRTFLIQL